MKRQGMMMRLGDLDMTPDFGRNAMSEMNIFPSSRDTDGPSRDHDDRSSWSSPGARIVISDGVVADILGRVILFLLKLACSGVRDAAQHISASMRRSDPEWVIGEVIRLAQRRGGVVTVLLVMTELSVTEFMAAGVLDYMAGKKICLVERIDGTTTKRYIFPAFKARVEVRKCEYCGSVFKADEVKEKCSNCGALLACAG